MSGETIRARLRAVVRGRVQWVSFRYRTVQEARALDLRGWVRNLPDGRSVEVLAEGPRPALEALLAWLQRGPPQAYVEAVEAEWSEARGDQPNFRMVR